VNNSPCVLKTSAQSTYRPMAETYMRWGYPMILQVL
jgi:hypothetical protein